MVMTGQQTSEFAEPCIGSFNDPSAFVPPQLPVIFPFVVIVPMRANQFDVSFFYISFAGVGPCSHSVGLGYDSASLRSG
jgi:hypothetical protein